jgi:hypothetical protein
MPSPVLLDGDGEAFGAPTVVLTQAACQGGYGSRQLISVPSCGRW